MARIWGYISAFLGFVTFVVLVAIVTVYFIHIAIVITTSDDE